MPDKKWCDAVSRLAGMDRHELLDRSRQEVAKRTDAPLPRFGFDFAQGLNQSANTRLGRFFVTPTSVPAVLELICQRLPQQGRGYCSPGRQDLPPSVSSSWL
jgi:hypothetical protein